MRLMVSAILYDRSLFSWCQQLRCRQWLIRVSRQVSRSADGYVVIGFILLLILGGETGFLKVVLAALLAERTVYFFLKKYTRRDRPPEALPNFQSIIQASDRFSFPSGHTSAAFLMAWLIAGHYPDAVWAVYPWAVGVAFSRVMLGVHFPTDTVAGALLGTGIALLATGLV